MKSVRKIINQLSKRHIDEVRQEITKDKSFNKFTLQILDCYLNNQDEEDTIKILGLDPTPFRIFERAIYRSVLALYQIEDKSIRDLLDTSIFYSLYGSNQKTMKERSSELEQLFHSMKQFEIEQDSTSLLKELHQINIGTPLEAVYAHLYTKYQEIELNNEKALEYFTQLNLKLSSFLEDKANNQVQLTKEMIALYKMIRKLNLDTPNNTLKAILDLSKLILITFANQTQLLLEGNQELGQLLKACKEGIDILPFGLDRFYLKNVFKHTYAKHLAKIGNFDIAVQLIVSSNKKGLFDGFNFGFANHLSNEFLQQKNESQYNKEGNGILISLPEKLGLLLPKKTNSLRDYVSIFNN